MDLGFKEQEPYPCPTLDLLQLNQLSKLEKLHQLLLEHKQLTRMLSLLPLLPIPCIFLTLRTPCYKWIGGGYIRVQRLQSLATCAP